MEFFRAPTFLTGDFGHTNCRVVFTFGGELRAAVVFLFQTKTPYISDSAKQANLATLLGIIYIFDWKNKV